MDKRDYCYHLIIENKLFINSYKSRGYEKVYIQFQLITHTKK